MQYCTQFIPQQFLLKPRLKNFEVAIATHNLIFYEMLILINSKRDLPFTGYFFVLRRVREYKKGLSSYCVKISLVLGTYVSKVHSS